MLTVNFEFIRQVINRFRFARCTLGHFTAPSFYQLKIFYLKKRTLQRAKNWVAMFHNGELKMLFRSLIRHGFFLGRNVSGLRY